MLCNPVHSPYQTKGKKAKDAKKEANPEGKSGFVGYARSKGIQYKQLINICYLIVCLGGRSGIFSFALQ